MATPDPLAAVSPDVAARTKNILAAIASGGSSGLRAYEQSEADLRQGRTDAIGRAQARAGLIGGPEAQGFEAGASGQYDRRLGDLSFARTGFESNMAHLGAAHKNYLAQIAAAVPLVRADTDRQLSEKRASIEADLADDAAKRAAEDKPKATDIFNLSENLRGLYGQSTLKGTVGPNGRETTGSANIPAGRDGITDDLMMTAADNAAFNGTTVDYELAKSIAEASGLTPNETAMTITPSGAARADTKADKALAPVPTPDEKWIVSNVRGMDSTKAKQALASPEFLEAGRQATDYFAQAPLDDKGKINDGSDDYDGMSPKDAFRKYVYSLAGNKSMKDAAFQYYGINLAS